MPSPVKVFLKDPDEKHDYVVSWAKELGADTISTSSWTLPAGITQSSPAPSNTTTTATIWLTGGTHNVDYDLQNKIVTAGGRTHERTIRIRVRQR